MTDRNRQPWSQLLCSAALASALVLACIPQTASAQARFARWTSASSATFPVIPVYGCPNQFATHFPAIPWLNISRQLSAAMNEWFVGGGAHIRYKYAGDLPANDAQCADVPGTPTTGTVVVTAANSDPMGFFGFGQAWNANGIISAGRVTLFASSNGSPINWATGADYPATSTQLDFGMMFIHELGHTLGLNHIDQQDCVMRTFIGGFLGNSSLRTLSVTDRRALRDDVSYGYGPIQTTLTHRIALHSNRVWVSEGEPFVGSSINGGWVYRSPNASAYDVAITAALDNGMKTFEYTGGAVATNWRNHAETSFERPAIARNGARRVFAYVAPTEFNREVNTKYSDDGQNWSSPVKLQRLVGSALLTVESGTAPAIAYAGWKNVFVMATAVAPSGEILVRVSLDGGATFPLSYQRGTPLGVLVPNRRTFSDFGLWCQDFEQRCYIAFSDATSFDTPFRIVSISFSAAGYTPQVVQDIPIGNFSYGAGVACANAECAFGYRDRTSATLLNHNIISPPFTFGVGPAFSPALASQATPSMAFNGSTQEWTTWYAYSPLYAQ